MRESQSSWLSHAAKRGGNLEGSSLSLERFEKHCPIEDGASLPRASQFASSMENRL